MNLDLDAANTTPEADGTAQFAAALEAMKAADVAASEAAAKRIAETQQLRKVYGEFAGIVEKAEQRNKQMRNGMRDGTFQRHLRDVRQLSREYEKMRREVELTERYGQRLGGWLSRNDRMLGMARRVGGYAAGATVATGAALTRSGFSGTVEGNRLALEFRILSRELAGAFKPVIDVTTRVVRSVRKFMESLDTGSQNILMTVGGAAALYGGAKFIGAGGVMGMGARLLGAGAPAAAAAAAGGLGTAATVAGGVGTAAAAAGGSRLAGAAKWTGRNAGTIAKGAGVAGVAIGAATSGDYGRAREAGKSRLASSMISIGGALYDGWKMLPFTGENELDKARAKADKIKESRRKVSVAGGGFDEGGAAYDRLNSAISMVEAERDPSELGAAGWAPLLEEMKRMNATLEAARAEGRSPELVRPAR